MRFTQNKKGFTLIELLVVITIIGILAVGGTATFTKQIQKARDSTRLTDITSLNSGIQQYYQDYSVYPLATVPSFTSGTGGVKSYINNIPKDPKTGQTCVKGVDTSATACDYIYNVGDDSNLITQGKFRVSTGFEDSGNALSKAENTKDNGVEKARFEIGIEPSVSGASTDCKRTVAMTTIPTTTVVVTAGTQCATAVGILLAGG